MIEILSARELTPKEKRKQELQQEILKKQHELELLDSTDEIESSVNEAESTVNEAENSKEKVESTENTADNNTEKAESKGSLASNTSKEEKSATEKAKDKLWKLTADEEKVVSGAIKYDKEKEELTQTEINDILTKTKDEYDKIGNDAKFPIRNIVIMVVIALVLITTARVVGINKTKAVNRSVPTEKTSDGAYIKDITDELDIEEEK